MRELEYPFDEDLILKKKKKLRRLLKEEPVERVEKRVAILGGSTTSDIRQVMELFLLNYGISPVFYESEYNRYYEDAMFPNPELEAFAPDIIYIHTTNRNIQTYPVVTDDENTVEKLLQKEADRFRGIWQSIAERYRCPVIQNNFEMPYYRLMGNKDASDPRGRVHFITALNMEFYRYARTHDNFYICDINYLSAAYGLQKWADPFYYHMYKYALHVHAIPYLAFEVAKMIKSIFGKNKKGFVLDLDNTLWGGVIGDDGVENIALGPEESEGQVYSEFQEYIKAHQQMGVVLNIDSKNDRDNALAGLQHPDSGLSPDDFIVIKANWNPKDRNMKEIAEELNLLPESLVFVDDNPAERHIVRESFPGAGIPEIGEVWHYIENIDRNGYFEVTSLSEDDINRNRMYLENAERMHLQADFTDYGEYLESLEMKGTIRAFEPLYMARIAQLTNKSNQFNLTTKRYSQAEIQQIASDERYITLYGKLEDRFGDNGVVSVIIGYQAQQVCHLELWLMSCRVLKRDMEYAMMDALCEKCLERGITELRGYYYPTAKNGMVKDLYSDLGFTKTEEDESGNAVWNFEITQPYERKNRFISV